MFLHADVRLPNRAVELVQEARAGDFVAGGGFLPHFTGNVSGVQRRLLQGVERVWRERTRRFTWFAGDTAPFVRATRLAVAGGYPMTGFASDWDFATILRSLGRLAVISDSVLVNARRHILNGVVKTLAVTGSVEAMYHMGVNRPFLRRWYKRWLPSDR